MKLLIINDPHVSDRPPACRTETYRDDIIAKLMETTTIAEFEKVDCVLITGDNFHTKAASRVSHYLVQRIYEIMDKYVCKVFIVPGNHDLAAGRLDSVSKQPLGVIIKSSNVEYIPYGCHWCDVVPGVYNFMGDDILSNLEAVKPEHSVLVCHMPVAPPFTNFPYPYVSSEALVFQRWKAVIYGHQHQADGEYEVGNTKFINFGSIARGSLTPKTLVSKPCVCICDVSESGVENVKPILLKSVKPVEMVMKIIEYENKKLKEEDVGKFIDSIKDANLSMMSIPGIILVIRNMDIGEDVKKEAISILQEQQ